MKAYLLSTVLGAVDRKGQMSVPLRAFSDKQAADDGARLRTQALEEMLRCRLIDPDGSDAGGLGEFVLSLGIQGWRHVVDTYEVADGGLIVPAAPSIIIAR